MNSIQKGLLTLMVGGLAAGAFVGCDEDDSFDINSPSWLQDRVDSIANSKNSGNTGDTTKIEVTVSEVGLSDYSVAWWGNNDGTNAQGFSQYFSIPSGQQLTLRFTNHTSGANNWNNWNLCVANGQRTADSYAEYFVIRSDAYGWGGTLSTYDATNLTTNYAEVATAAGQDDQWAYFLSSMEGAEVEMVIQHVAAGYCYVTATATCTNGAVFVEEYHQECSASDDIVAFLVADNSYMVVNEAFLTPASIVITESNPARLELSGYPAFLTLGDSAYTAGLQAKVYYEDGTSADLDSADMSYVAPELGTPGTKTVTVLYNKTSRGNYCSPIYATYPLLITDFTAIEVVANDGFVYHIAKGKTSTEFIPASVTVYGISSDGSKATIATSDVTFSAVAADGTFTASYQGLTATGKVTTKEYTPDGTVLFNNQTVGTEDNSTVFWGAHSDKKKISAGETATFTFMNYTQGDNGNNWYNFIILLRSEDEKTEYGVLRADNFGWGTGWSSCTAESTASTDWPTWLAAMNGAKVSVTITLSSDGTTADVTAIMVGNNDVTYTQTFKGVAISNPEDVYFNLTLEKSHLVID